VSELDGLVGRPNGTCSERDGEFCAGDVVSLSEAVKSSSARTSRTILTASRVCVFTAKDTLPRITPTSAPRPSVSEARRAAFRLQWFRRSWNRLIGDVHCTYDDEPDVQCGPFQILMLKFGGMVTKK
jgi:hypothetical protein